MINFLANSNIWGYNSENNLEWFTEREEYKRNTLGRIEQIAIMKLAWDLLNKTKQTKSLTL